MIENFEQFLNSYGYFAVFIGTFLEGEFALLVAGFFIKHGFLVPLPTLIFSILGALVHELIYFFLGRWKGRYFLLGNKYTKRKYRKMKSLIQKYGIFSLFIIRFTYGMRVVPMMLMGAFGFNFYKFLFFNILSLIIWAVLFLYVGYLFGHVAIMLFGEAKYYFFIVGMVVAVIGLLIYLISSSYKKIKAQRVIMKDLISIDQLNQEDIENIFKIAKEYKERFKNGEKKFNDLRGYSVLLVFFENSTRTRTSFELAGKILGADTINISASSSSVKKGETLYDTVKTLEAMNTDFIVIRHYMSGAANIVAKSVKSHVINAGDGTYQHPSQALLDAFTIIEKKGTLTGLKIAIIGDILHSRVARSDIKLFKKLGGEITVCGPITMLPRHAEVLSADYITTDIEDAIKDKDVVIFLRVQLERQDKPFFSSLREYSIKYGLNQERLNKMKEDTVIMHPGPVNRGIEIQSELVYRDRSLILDQVENGLFVRMAIYKYLKDLEGKV